MPGVRDGMISAVSSSLLNDPSPQTYNTLQATEHFPRDWISRCFRIVLRKNRAREKGQFLRALCHKSIGELIEGFS